MSVGATLMWPTVAVLGFVVLTGLVVALGASSTARYEFERNGAREQRRSDPARATGRHPAGSRSPNRGSGAQARLQPAAVGVAVRPAVGGASGAAWWLVGEFGASVLAGPFADRVDADWAALAGGLPARRVYGVLRTDGALATRPSPEERAWLGGLEQQLTRLGEDWEPLLSDADALTTLAVEVTAALVEAGLPLHDGTRRGPAGALDGGVCLAPHPERHGVLVSWRSHDRMSVQLARGAAADAAVQQVMNAAVADLLAQLGFAVEPFGATGCHLVSAIRG